MALGVHLLVNLADDSLGIDDEGSTLPEFHSLPLGLTEPDSLHQRRIRVSQQIDGEGEFRAETFVRSSIVGADADDRDTGGVEVRFGGGEAFALDGAARSVVLGIK